MSEVKVRKFYIDQALSGYAGLRRVLNDLTMEELLAALELESATMRRRSVIDRLVSRAIRLNEILFTKQLRSKYAPHESTPVPPRTRNQEG
jgi:hypothetical protein